MKFVGGFPLGANNAPEQVQPTLLSGSLMDGWVGDPSDNAYPSAAEMEEFMTGISINTSIGALGGAGINWNPINEYYANNLAYEFGMVLIAQAGISASYTWKIK